MHAEKDKIVSLDLLETGFTRVSSYLCIFLSWKTMDFQAKYLYVPARLTMNLLDFNFRL